MLKIDPHSKTLLSLGRRTLQPASLFDRYPVADFIANSADVFFADLGRAFFLVGRDVPVSAAGRRADLLLLDPEGRLFVARLQRGRKRIDLVDALEDAGCVSSWSSQRILTLLNAERREMLEKAFLKTPLNRINQEQGVLLLGESFDLETLASAGWLKTRYGVRIDCYQLKLATDSLTRIEYLSCQDLTRQVNRVYQRRQSVEPAGAPWPVEAVPDISDGPKEPAAKAQPESRPEAPPPAPEPAPVSAEPEVEPEPPSPLEAEVEAALGSEESDEIFFTGELSPEEDPLADIIAGQEAAEEEEAETGTDRRGAERSRDYQARRLRLDYFGRLLGARLVDFSKSGMGVEALSPLPVGAEIGISGEVLTESKTHTIEGRAKVEHCRSTQEGVCRIGFSFDARTVIKDVDDPESFDRR
jgi:hypothetical protein